MNANVQVNKDSIEKRDNLAKREASEKSQKELFQIRAGLPTKRDSAFAQAVSQGINFANL